MCLKVGQAKIPTQSCLSGHCPSHSGSPNIPVLTFKSTKSTIVRKDIKYSEKKHTG